MAELTLHTRYASADHQWRGEWLQGFDPYSSTWLEQVRQAFGQEDVATKTQASFTVRAPYGAVWMMQLDWANPQQHLLHMKLQHLGDYLPWPVTTEAGVE